MTLAQVESQAKEKANQANAALQTAIKIESYPQAIHEALKLTMILEMKEEYRRLDSQEEQLKLTRCGDIETPEMQSVRAKKKEIADKIFKQ